MRIRTGVERPRGPSFLFFFTFWVLLNLPATTCPPPGPLALPGCQPCFSCPASLPVSLGNESVLFVPIIPGLGVTVPASGQGLCWFPLSHPALTQGVAHGGGRGGAHCKLAHLPTGGYRHHHVL